MGWSTMRLSRLFVIAVALAASSTAWAQSAKYEGVGRPATDDEINVALTQLLNFQRDRPAHLRYMHGHARMLSAEPLHHCGEQCGR